MSEAFEPPGPQQSYGLAPGEAARLADELQRNPLFEIILAEMDSSAIDVWRRSSSPVQREEQWHLMIAIQKLRQMLQGRIETVKLADARVRRAART